MTTTFAEFATEGTVFPRSCECWESTGLYLYVRKAIRPVGGFEIANVKVTPESGRSQGIFSRFIASVEHEYPLMIEYVANRTLARHFHERKGWTLWSRPGDINPNACFANDLFLEFYEKQETERSKVSA